MKTALFYRMAPRALLAILVIPGVIIVSLILWYVCYSLSGVRKFSESVPDFLGDNGFQSVSVVPCNRLHTREVGFYIDPPIPSSAGEASLKITGEVVIEVRQDGRVYRDSVDLSKSGWVIDSRGIKMKTISRYPPIGSVFCSEQTVTLEASNINFDMKDHRVKVYISSDRRP